MEEKLNFLEKNKIKRFLNKPIYSTNDYLKLSPKLQKNKAVLQKMIDNETKNKINAFIGDILLETFKDNPMLFKKEAICKLIDYIMDNKKYEYLKYINAEYANYLYEKYLKDNTSLYLKIRKYFSSDLLHTLSSLIEIQVYNLTHDEQKQCFADGLLDFTKLTNKVQAELTINHPEYLPLIKENGYAFTEFIKLNPEYLKEFPQDIVLCSGFYKGYNFELYSSENIPTFQVSILEKYPQCLNYLNLNDQIEFLNNPEHYSFYTYLSSYTIKQLFQDSNCINIILYIINDNPSYLKYVGYTKDIKNNNVVSEALIEYFHKQNMDINKLIEIILKTSLLSSKGSLRKNSSSYYHGEERVAGVDIYTNSQLQLIDSLSIEEIMELMKLDITYVLAYLLPNEKFVNGEYVEINRAKSLLRKVIKVDDYTKFDHIIDLVYTRYRENYNMKDTIQGPNYEFDIPIESFKILFNPKIIANNTEEDIVKYYELIFNNQDGSKLFKKIIINAYPKAAKILEERNNIDVYAINSLEIFEDVVFANFSTEFINDLISYNIREMQTFLYIVKNKEDLELFKLYYEKLSSIMGQNIDTMQKCISEYFINKNLLTIVKNEKLTSEELNNAVICLCSDNNLYDINTLEELKKFEKIKQEKMLEEISSVKSFNSMVELKEIISKYILDINYYIHPDCRNVTYGEMLYDILKIYDIDKTFDYLTADEKKLMDIIKFIDSFDNFNYYPKDYLKMEELAINLANTPNICNPKILYSAINKIRTHEIELLNSKLLTKEKLDKICQREEEKESKLAEKIETADGVAIYFLEGLDLDMEGLEVLYHSMSMAADRDFMSYEAQASMSTISARITDNMFTLTNTGRNFLIFSHIGPDELLTYNEKDANVAHTPKVIRSGFGSGESISHKLPDGNEVAFYRRIRNHDQRAEDLSGRIRPAFICLVNHNEDAPSLRDVDSKTYEYALKHHIPIIVFKSALYTKKYNESLEKGR